MYLLIYRLVTGFYFLLIRLYALFNTKAKAWVEGRKNWQAKLSQATKHWQGCNWFHCASLGEFEQGRPLIEQFKKAHPTQKILLTFFSPSGYLVRKNYPIADYVAYLPADSPKNAQQFLNIVQPKLVVFVKYEWWYYFSKAIFERQIPFYNISCIFRKEQLFFKHYGSLHRQILSFYTHLFVQDAESKKLLETIEINHVTVSGDTRFDRVWESKNQLKPLSILQQFKNETPIIIGGSTYPIEDNLLIELMKSESALSNFKYIIVPHDIDKSYCQTLKETIPISAKLYSEINEGDDLSDVQVLIINSIGLLNTSYAYADYALIGGGFAKGIHNILEAVVFGLPVFFGPHYHKAKEAVDLIEQQLAFSVERSEQILDSIITFEKDINRKNKLQVDLTVFVEDRVGATQRIYEAILKSLV